MKTSLIFEILGTAGSLILCGSAIPQIVKTYRTKSSGDLSIMYLATLMLGLMLLMVYSIYVRDFVFIFGNTLALSSTGVMILFWFKYRIQEQY
jgi:MtN3 and saliva related transmembrane protein